MKKQILSMVLFLAVLTFQAQVGIGTITPSAQLDIVSTGNTSTTKALEVNNSANSPLLSVIDNGYVGIGTATPISKFDVRGLSSFQPTIFTNNLELIEGFDVENPRFYLDESALEIQSDETDPLKPITIFRNSTSAVATILANGKVGIGTSTPLFPLNVSSGAFGFAVDRHHASTGNQSIIAIRKNLSNDPNTIVPLTSGATIGSVSFSGATGGTTAFGPYAPPGNSTRIAARAEGQFSATSAASSLLFFTTPEGSIGASTRMIIDKDGKVGIGTTTPNNNLHIVDGVTSGLSSMYGKGLAISSTNSRIYLESTSSPTNERVFQINNSEGLFSINALSNSADATMPIPIAPAAIGVKASNGFVGINVNSPTERLDVAGNVKFSGALMPNNTAGTAGQVLTSAGANLPPTWTNVSGGTSNALNNSKIALGLQHENYTATTGWDLNISFYEFTGGIGDIQLPTPSLWAEKTIYVRAQDAAFTFSGTQGITTPKGTVHCTASAALTLYCDGNFWYLISGRP